MKKQCICGHGDICGKEGSKWTEEEAHILYYWFCATRYIQLGRYIWGRCGGDDVLAEEAIDKGLDNVKKYSHSYDPSKQSCRKDTSCPYASWVFAIVTRMAARLRAEWGQIFEPGEFDELVRTLFELPPATGAQDDFDLIANLSASDHQAAYSKIAKMFAKEINRLTLRQKEAFEFRFRDRLSYKEAAKRSEWPCSARTMRGRKFQAVTNIIKWAAERGAM